MTTADPSPRDAPLDGLWHLAATSRELAPGALTRRLLFGEPILLGRTKTGAAFAMRDVCPHRAAPLSAGRLVEAGGAAAVECPYHGWAFRASDGRCVAVPALAADARFDPSRISAGAYPLHETNGLLFLYRGEGEAETAPPDIGLDPAFRPRAVTVVEAAGPFDEAVIGLVDPAHTPVVHKQWWWREGAPRRDKTKNFAPTPLGFKMPAHPPSSNSRIYKLLGGAPTTEIEFRLPALRLEHVRVGGRRFLGLTAMTPIDAGRTRIMHCLYWDHPLLTALTPILQRMADGFLGQDGHILRLQNENLKLAPHRPLFLGDPDEPAKWYLRLKKAWAERRETGGFVNPVAGGDLRWRT